MWVQFMSQPQSAAELRQLLRELAPGGAVSPSLVRVVQHDIATGFAAARSRVIPCDEYVSIVEDEVPTARGTSVILLLASLLSDAAALPARDGSSSIGRIAAAALARRDAIVDDGFLAMTGSWVREHSQDFPPSQRAPDLLLMLELFLEAPGSGAAREQARSAMVSALVSEALPTVSSAAPQPPALPVALTGIRALPSELADTRTDLLSLVHRLRAQRATVAETEADAVRVTA
jgi:hypothetical protein